MKIEWNKKTGYTTIYNEGNAVSIGVISKSQAKVIAKNMYIALTVIL